MTVHTILFSLTFLLSCVIAGTMIYVFAHDDDLDWKFCKVYLALEYLAVIQKTLNMAILVLFYYIAS